MRLTKFFVPFLLCSTVRLVNAQQLPVLAPPRGQELCMGGPCAPLDQAAVVIEGEVADYVPGVDGGGLLVAVRSSGGALFGLSIGAGTQSVRSEERVLTATAWGFGVTMRARAYSTADHRVSLDAGLDARLAYGIATGITQVWPMALEKSRGFVIGVGPSVTYWLHPMLGISYSPRLTYLQTSGSDSKLSRTLLMNVVRAVVAF
jgi:hypothetical protein